MMAQGRWRSTCPSALLRCLASACAALTLAGPAQAGPWRGNDHNSPGWRWMTPAERVEHQRRLRATRSLAECKAYLAEHHEQLRERARRAGQDLGPPHGEDACDRLWAGRR